MLIHALACLNIRKKKIFFKPSDLAFLEDGINIAWINVLSPWTAISHTLQRFSIYISRCFNSLSQNFRNDRLKESFQGCSLFFRTQFFYSMHFLFIKNIADSATEKSDDWELYFFHSGLVHFLSHLCEFSCRFSLLQLYTTDILLRILMKIFRLRGSNTFLENPFPIVSNYKVVSGYGVTRWLCRSQGTSSSGHSCSGKSVSQQNKNASHWGAWLATMHMKMDRADKGPRGHPWRTTRQRTCAGRKEI